MSVVETTNNELIVQGGKSRKKSNFLNEIEKVFLTMERDQRKRAREREKKHVAKSMN